MKPNHRPNRKLSSIFRILRHTEGKKRCSSSSKNLKKSAPVPIKLKRRNLNLPINRFNVLIKNIVDLKLIVESDLKNSRLHIGLKKTRVLKLGFNSSLVWCCNHASFF